MGAARSWFFATFPSVTLDGCGCSVGWNNSLNINLTQNSLLPGQAALKVYFCMLDLSIWDNAWKCLSPWGFYAREKSRLSTNITWVCSGGRFGCSHTHSTAEQSRANLECGRTFEGNMTASTGIWDSPAALGGVFMAVTLGSAGRDFSSSAAMLSTVLEQGFNIKYREQARYHLVLETWFTPSSGGSSTENSSCWLPSEMWNWGHLCSSKKWFSFWWERSPRVLEQQNQVLRSGAGLGRD